MSQKTNTMTMKTSDTPRVPRINTSQPKASTGVSRFVCTWSSSGDWSNTGSARYSTVPQAKAANITTPAATIATAVTNSPVMNWNSAPTRHSTRQAPETPITIQAKIAINVRDQSG